MKKTYLMMASALVMTMAVTTAEARDGIYLAARGGYTDYNMNSKEDSATAKPKVELGSGWHVSGALGYKYKYFRVEGEYIYRDDTDDRYVDAILGGVENGHNTSMESDSFMANAYLDFMPNYWISPYITGGIGISRLELSTQAFPGVHQKVSYDENNFTWQVGAGLSLRLNRCLNFDAGYRYIDMGEIYDADMNAHEWYGGLRYTF